MTDTTNPESFIFCMILYQEPLGGLLYWTVCLLINIFHRPWWDHFRVKNNIDDYQLKYFFEFKSILIFLAGKRLLTTRQWQLHHVLNHFNTCITFLFKLLWIRTRVMSCSQNSTSTFCLFVCLFIHLIYNSIYNQISFFQNKIK